MKRCPQCHRVESDDSLAFCRADGSSLVTDSLPVSGEAGTVLLGSEATETATNILPHATGATVNRSTGPTTALPLPTPSSGTGELTKPKRNWVALAVVVLAAATISIGGYFYFTRKPTTTIQSIAVMPFVNESGNADVDYLSDGMTETLISSLSQLPNLNVKARSSVFRYKGKETNPARRPVNTEFGVN